MPDWQMISVICSTGKMTNSPAGEVLGINSAPHLMGECRTPINGY